MITLQQAEFAEVRLRARMPFRYGIATMTEVPHLVVRLTFTIEGEETSGLAADHLPPKWFTKDPTRALEDEVAEMRRVIANAVRLARGVTAATPFAFWRELYAAQGAWATARCCPGSRRRSGCGIGRWMWWLPRRVARRLGWRCRCWPAPEAQC